MSWTGSERQRKSQLATECPEGFAGASRYVDRAAVAPSLSANDQAVWPFGQHRGRPVGDTPRSYLEWAWRTVRLNGKLRAAVRSLLGPSIADALDGPNSIKKAKRRRRPRRKDSNGYRGRKAR